MQSSTSTTLRFIRYGILGLPLAFVGLPIYVHVPAFYAVTLHVELGLLGSTLLAIRLLDTVLDPLIGVISDRFSSHRKKIMAACVPLLAGGYILLFSPPAWAEVHALLWLGVCLALVYLTFSTLMINYYAMGVVMAESYDENTRISAWREGSMLAGVLLASLTPPILLQWVGVREAYHWFSLSLVPLLFVCAYITLSVSLPRVVAEVHNAGQSFMGLLKSGSVRWVLLIALFNAIPNAITSTLFMFFTADVLHAGQQSGFMLAVYFLSAAFAMPLWAYLSTKLGKRLTLLCAMLMAIVCFVWAWQLGSGAVTPFYVICVLSGMAMGADVALLPALFADALAGMRESSGAGFGLWNLTSKLTMALAAGISLPVLAFAGYHAEGANTEHALAWLSISYGLLPCAFKLFAAFLLYISPLDPRRIP